MSPTSDRAAVREAALRQGALREQFVHLEQQREADTLGMWIFLATEVLLFGALFAAYTVYRLAFGPAFEAAASHMHLWLGTLNTVLLMTSSLTMALGVLAARARARGHTLLLLGLTAGLGVVFLGIKFYEWYREYSEGLVPLPWLTFAFEGDNPDHARMFFNLYFTMTGLHALHLIMGVCIVTVMLALAWRRHNPVLLAYKVEIAGLYWHLVDVIWMFLFPLFYLVNPHG